jgi:hypothetical protein
MRTKTLLLTAVLSAAGVATSMAQVFLVNAVGYVNKTIPKGNKLALISNPLDAGIGNNTIANLFKGAPEGTQVYVYDGTGFTTATMDPIDLVFLPDAAAKLEVKPGDGVFVRNTSANDYTVTFVGEVPQGQLDNPLPKGLSIQSSMVPQTGTAKELGLPGDPGDQVFQFDPATQGYYVSTFDPIDLDWLPPLKPLAVGEAFFLRRGAAGTWSRNFSVN